MNPRRVRVPVPRELLSLAATGPISPASATSAEAAELSVFNALADAAADEVTDTGWCCWWASPPRHAGHVVRLDLWVDDDTAGRRSLEALRSHLEAASFLVQSSGRRSTPAAVQRSERPLHARVRVVRAGRLSGDLPLPFELVEDLEAVQVPRRWRWPVQRCPSCGLRGHPVERIAGFPSAEAQLAADLGEAVLAGCLVDPDDDFDAECSRCGRSFQPRETTGRQHG